MNKKLGVYIGRFQPFHNGHKATVDRMLEECPRAVVIIGTPFDRSEKNPFNFYERREMILRAYPFKFRGFDPALKIILTQDNPDDKIWAANVMKLVDANNFRPALPVALYGCKKDASSFYLDMFKGWEDRLTDVTECKAAGTNCRMMIRGGHWGNLKNFLPPKTFDYVKWLVTENEPDTCHKWLRPSNA